MSIICTDPSARNYNLNDSLPCIYTLRKSYGCFVFREVTTEATIVDESFTLSMDKDIKNWVFFHGYTPDYYVHTRDKLFSVKDSKLYEHNNGQPGIYYNNTKQPFIIDLVFSGPDAVLETISWVSSVTNAQGQYKEFATFTHIMAWNSVQCTGLIPLQDILTLQEGANHRKTMSTFTFNDIRDAVVNRGGEFLGDVFSRYAPTFTPEDVPWYDKALLKDNYFVIRFMHDNGVTAGRAGEKITLHDVNIQRQNTIR